VFPTTIEVPHKPFYGAVTSAYNVLAALVGVVLLSPLLIVIAVAVKATSAGPALYRGARVGRGERRFYIYKFRTMKIGSEHKIGKRLVQEGEDHYTSIGRFLRKYRLDELSQLFNVLRRDMNLVGPRPIRPIFLADHKANIQGYTRRFLVRPGITGQAQVRGGYYTSPRHKLYYDMLYIARRTVIFDLQLIVLTFVRVMTRIFTATLLLAWLLVVILVAPPDITSLFAIDFAGANLNPLYLVPTLIVLVHLLRRGIVHGRVAAMRTPVDLPLMGFLGWSAVLVAFSPLPMGALRGLGWYLCNGVVVLYLVLNSRMVTDRRATFLATLIGATVVMGILELIPWGAAGLRSGQFGRLMGPLFNPVLLATTVTLALPLAVSRTRRATGLSRTAYASAAVILLAVGLLTSSRSGILAMAIVLTVYWWGQSRRAVVTVVTVAVLVIGALAALGDGRMQPSRALADLQRVTAQQSVGLDAIDADVRVSAAHWSTGIGARVTGRMVRPSKDEGEWNFVRLDNMYLTLFVDHGPLGLLFFLAFLVSALGTMFQSARSVEDPDARDDLRATASGLVGATLMFLVSDALYRLPLMVTFFALMGLGLGIALHYRPGPRRVYRLIHYRHQL
jgi:lipopolysaccharide/colanic/teichoic acid biosynthesis glycosyltransferase